MDILIKNRHGREVPVPESLALKIQDKVEIKGKIVGHDSKGYITEPVRLHQAPRKEQTIVDLSGREIAKEKWERTRKAKSRR